MENELFVCACGNVEHQLIFSYFPEDEDNTVYASVLLKPVGFWMRLKNAVLYLFGHRSKHGDFTEFLFNPDDADRLQKVVDILKR